MREDKCTKKLLVAEASPLLGGWEHKEGDSEKYKRKRNVLIFGIVLLFILALFRLKSHPMMPTSEICYGSDVDFFNIPKHSYEPPLSTLSPMELGFPAFYRPETSSPKSVFGDYLHKSVPVTKRPLPTNRWFQNIIAEDQTKLHDDEIPLSIPRVSDASRIYSVPYVIDPVGPIAGIRVHFPWVLGGGTIVQSIFEPSYSLTLGTVYDPKGVGGNYEIGNINNPSSDLMIKLVWPGKTKDNFMAAPIVRGMPYGTMHYAKGVIPTIASDRLPFSPPLVDQEHELKCDGSKLLVNKEIKIHFEVSDFTWLVFFSRPVHVQCYENKEYEANFAIRVSDEDMADGPITVRVALSDSCTSESNVTQYCKILSDSLKQNYANLLREHADIYPDESYVHYEFENKHDPTDVVQDATIQFVWDAKDMTSAGDFLSTPNSSGLRAPVLKSTVYTEKKLLMYALPHHIDQFQDNRKDSDLQILEDHCLSVFHGTSCLVVGDQWKVVEDLGGLPSTVAPRPPHHSVIPDMAKAIAKDILFTPPDNYMRGAGDTYFSGKVLAKLARIIEITAELKGLAAYKDQDINGDPDLQQIVNACKSVVLPSDEVVRDAVERLKQGTEVWLNSSAESVMTYDAKWGGFVNCGCWFDESTRSCSNRFPICPAYDDAGMNFGNAFYNDHHFHYGYHIYAAAVVSKHDHEWGKKYFQHVLMFIRDVANPSHNDESFPVFRHKDWYLGSSWASGIATIAGKAYPNGRNQESSSESIAAYEAIALYGHIMLQVWNQHDEKFTHCNKVYSVIASRIRELGRLLTATEIRSADRYWHVRTSPGAERVYPDVYSPAVVGMLWSLMAQCQTWFGGAPYLAYGIQLLPITPVTEVNYQIDWLKDMYIPFASDCESNRDCENQGWSLLQFAVLASLGHRDEAVSRVLSISDDVYSSAGGNGHSKTNMLWFLGTRPATEKYDLSVKTFDGNTGIEAPMKITVNDCGCESTCTSEALSSDASGYSCKDRIQWMIDNKNLSEEDACKQVGSEYTQECGVCDPSTSCGENLVPTNKSDVCDDCGENDSDKTNDAEQKDSCDDCEQNSDNGVDKEDSEDGACGELCKFNAQCPPQHKWYVCAEGASRGGCSPLPWIAFGGTPTPDCRRCCKTMS